MLSRAGKIIADAVVCSFAPYGINTERLLNTEDVSTENLCFEDTDLTMFARNSYSFDYTVVRCVLKSKSSG